MPKKLKKGSDIMDFDSMLNSQLGKIMGLTEKDRPKFEKRNYTLHCICIRNKT